MSPRISDAERRRRRNNAALREKRKDPEYREKVNAPRRMSVVVPKPDARSYSWTPFDKGNLLGVRHGARSPRVYAPLAEKLATWLLAERPDLEPYRVAVNAWAVAETRAALLREYAEQVGLIDEQGELRGGLLQWISKTEASAAKAAAALGLTPGTHAALIRERADATTATWDVESAIAAGRQHVAPVRAELPEPVVETPPFEDEEGDEHEQCP